MALTEEQVDAIANSVKALLGVGVDILAKNLTKSETDKKEIKKNETENEDKPDTEDTESG